jgi:hypothetical protein
MRLFVASRAEKDVRELVASLSRMWAERAVLPTIGQYLVLVWDAAVRLYESEGDPISSLLKGISGQRVALNDVSIWRIQLSSRFRPADLSGATFANAELSSIEFVGANLRNADFSRCVLENANFRSADLTGATFNDAWLIDCIFDDTVVTEAQFKNISEGSSIIVEQVKGGSLPSIRADEEMRALLMYKGAKTDPVSSFMVYRNHPKFDIAEKICRKMKEQALHQRRGLEQRGAARRDTEWARAFVGYLEKCEFLAEVKARPDLVNTTSEGRDIFARFCEGRELCPEIEDFFRDNPD